MDIRQQLLGLYLSPAMAETLDVLDAPFGDDLTSTLDELDDAELHALAHTLRRLSAGFARLAGECERRRLGDA